LTVADPVAGQRFVLAEHSIKRIGGHHLEHARHMLEGAAGLGFRPVLATHRKFRGARALPSGWPVHRVFRATTYDLARSDRPPAPAAVADATRPGTLACLVAAWRRGRARAMRCRFAADAVGLLQGLGLRAGEHVLFSTVGLVELEALAEVAGRPGVASPATVHLMFHFPPFDGRGASVHPKASRYGRALREAAAHGIRFWSTTDALASWLSSVGEVTVRPLPWAVDPSFGEASAAGAGRREAGPIRIGVPGSARDERGTAIVEDSFVALQARLFDGSAVQLMVQAKRLAKLPPAQSRCASFHGNVPAALASRSPVAAVKWPLDGPEYRRFVESTDIGLLPYDPDRYFARASGVLVEFLCAGKPVIVPAGCWLGREIRERTWSHVEDVLRRGTADRPVPWSGAAEVRVDSGWSDAVLAFPDPSPADRCLAVSMRWIDPAGQSAALHLEVTTCDRSGAVRRWDELIERRPPPAGEADPVAQAVLVPIPAGSAVRSLRLRRRYGDAPVVLRDLATTWVSGRVPIGAVGLQAFDGSMVPPLIEEMVRNVGHYAVAAAEFAPAYRRMHHPATAVAMLVGTP
jgi:hypothetical protein